MADDIDVLALSKRIQNDPSLLAMLESIVKKSPVRAEKIDPFSRPPHHSLKAITYCNLCHSYVIKFFNMYSDGGTKYLSKPVQYASDLVEPVTKTIMAVMSCPQCKHALAKWSKERLILALIKNRTAVIDEYFKFKAEVSDMDTTTKEEEDGHKTS